MKEQIDKLKSFLKIVGLSGDRTISEMVFELEKDSIKTISKSLDQSTALLGVIKTNPFNIGGKLGIANLQKFVQYLDLIEIKSFKIENNRIIIKGKDKKASILLKKPEFIVDTVADCKLYDKLLNILTDGISFKIDVDKLKVIENYMKITTSDYFNLIVSNKLLKIEVGTNNTDKINEDIEINYNGDKEIKIALKTAFIDAIKNINGEVIITIKEGAPVKVSINNDDLSIDFLIAQAG